MKMIAIHEREKIEAFLNNVSTDNFFYHCNNLEKGYWERTQWFGLCEGEDVLALAMLILDYELPVLLASCYREGNVYQLELVEKLLPYLPTSIYCHLDVGTAYELFTQTKDVQVTPFFNMKLSRTDVVSSYDINSVQQLGKHDLDEIISFLEESHPDYLLEEEFVEQGYYYGIREGGSLISLAGLVAKSDAYSVVSIGNVATHPNYRQRNLASQTISALIHSLSPKYQTITLNVKVANEPAIRCYKRLGFIETGTFEAVIC